MKTFQISLILLIDAFHALINIVPCVRDRINAQTAKLLSSRTVSILYKYRENAGKSIFPAQIES